MKKLLWNGDKIVRRIEGRIPKTTSSLAKIVSDTAQRLCPVKSGELKASIRVEDNTVVAGGGDVDYVLIVELGTSKRAAQPFLRPATEQLSRDDVRNSI